MTVDPAPGRPAVAPALALLCGIAWGSAWAPVAAWLAIAIAAAAGAVLVRCARGWRRGCVLVTCAALGAASGAAAQARAAARTALWLPATGSATEILLVGTVVRAPERDRGGERWLRLEARPRPDPATGAPPALVRLVVRAPTASAALDALRHGDRVRVFARVRASRRQGAAWGVDATGSVKSARLVEKTADGAMSPARALDVALVAARARLDRALGADGEARYVAAAMILGDRAGLDPDALRALRESGLFHLLAISGLNVGLVVGAALFVMRRARLSRWPALVVAVAGVWAFGVLVGGDAPVARACAAAGVALFGRTLGRDGDALNSLALVAAGVAVCGPAVVFHPGFQLTFAATAALVVLARPCAAAIPAPRPIALALGASAAAYAATAPILVAHFGRLAPVGLVSNLAAGPLCAAILGSGAAVLATGDLPVAGPAAAGALRASVAALDAVSRAAAGAPLATVRTAPPAWLVGAAAVLLVLAWRVSRREGGGALGRLARAGAVVALVALHLGSPPRAPGVAEVAVLDVGQGQAVAVREGNGRCLLFDGGGSGGGRFDAGERIVAPWLARWGCRRLEAIFVSHAHDDHVGGLASVLREFDTGALWLAAGSWRDGAARELAGLARERGAAMRLAAAGAGARHGTLEVEILHPAPRDASLPINDRCAVARLVARSGASLLVPGDLERAGEERVLARGARVATGALVAGHHGAASSSTRAWLESVGARLAVVSAGEGNRFGHPARATLERLRRAGAVTFRTDRDGDVVLREEDGGWRVGSGPLRGRSRTGPG